MGVVAPGEKKMARRPLYLLMFLMHSPELELRTQASYINLYYSD